MDTFFISKNGETVGPWSIQKVFAELELSHLQLSDYIYHPQMQEWQMLLTSPLIPDSYKNITPENKNQNSHRTETSDSSWTSQEWFIYKSNKQEGPYQYLDVVKMLQHQKLFDYDFVWSPSLETWTKVYECQAFSADQIKKLSKNEDLKKSTVFFRRQYPRVDYQSKLIIHNEKKIWRAESTELSAGGCGFVMTNAPFEKGDRLIVHFTPTENNQVPPFNALCTIVSKFNDNKKGNKAVRYGLKFEALNQDIQLTIRSFTERAA